MVNRVLCRVGEKSGSAVYSFVMECRPCAEFRRAELCARTIFLRRIFGVLNFPV